MNATYQFLAKLPSNGLVASSVTLLVSAWFAVASGAILADPVSPYTQRPAPQFRETITVTAKASDALPQYRETITVVAKAVPQHRETITVVAKAVPQYRETITVVAKALPARQTVQVVAQPGDVQSEQPASL